MSFTLAFDVYGTLIDTQGVVAELRPLVGDQAVSFSSRWREKQLEYAFRRGLMQNYESFAVCTSNALDYTCSYYGVSLSDMQKKALLELYKSLPAFDDVKGSLTSLRDSGFRIFAFSNGTSSAVEQLLEAAQIRSLFLDVVSVDDLKSFKPNPAVYSYFLRKSKTTADQAWLISSNPFDVIGAISAGMRSAWIQRSKDALFDPWGIEPTLRVGGLHELPSKLMEINK